MSLKPDVKLEGLSQTLSRLREFDRDAYDGMVQEISDAMEPMASDARGLMPSGNALSNWGPWGSSTVTRQSRGGVWTQTARRRSRSLEFDSGKARAGVEARTARKYRKGKMLGATAMVAQKNPAGSIWALAGARDAGNPFAMGGSATFVSNLLAKYRSDTWPRAMGEAWTKNIEKVRDAVENVIEKYARKASSD